MEGGDHGLRDAETADQFLNAFSHFRSGFIGEGHRQNGFRHDSGMFDQVGDAVGDDAGFPAARAGKDEHRTFGGFDRLALLRIELIEKRQCGSGSGSDDLILQGIEVE
jgi:hypothetical protein